MSGHQQPRVVSVTKERGKMKIILNILLTSNSFKDGCTKIFIRFLSKVYFFGGIWKVHQKLANKPIDMHYTLD